MSHEIRTPMNGVLGFANIGYRNYQDSEKSRNAFEKILTSGNQLLGVVNEILDFSKIDAGKLQIEATEMSIGEVLEQSGLVPRGWTCAWKSPVTFLSAAWATRSGSAR
jgi:signal transduction histidine kinase